MKNFIVIGKELGTNYCEAVICKADNSKEATNKGFEYFEKYKIELERIYVTEISNDHIKII